MTEFHSMGDFAKHLLEIGSAQLEAQHHALEKAAVIVEDAAKARIGQYQQAAGPFAGWAELADSTKADRVAQGYPEDEPLLRDGTLRDSIEHVAGLTEAHIGSNLDVAVYQELGTATIPPRSFLGGAAAEKSESVARILGQGMVAALFGKEVVNGLLPID